MRPLFILAILVSFVAAYPVASASAAPVGKVTRVQKEAQVGSTTAAAGTPVHMGDQLRTGPDSRLQVTFVDNTVLTLGENARVVVDRYVYNPEQGTGEVALTASRAALHFTTGKLNQLREKSITVNTPVAALAVRGTVFWAGIVDYQYGVLLVNGKLNVSNSAGSQNISRPNHGIDFPPLIKKGPTISAPYEWSAAKIQKALATTAFAQPPFIPPIPPGLFIPDDDKPSSP